jgi:branched-chain amino acid transport system substrate-binding protein
MVRGFLEVGKAFNIENLGDIRHPLGTTDFSTLLPRIQALKPDILCISNFGRDQQIALKQATDFGVKKTTQIIAPLLSHASRVAAGPQAFDGVIGGCSFYWGIEDKFASTKAFNAMPSARCMMARCRPITARLAMAACGRSSTAVKNAGSVDTDKVIAALEALKYDFYKGPQYYRKCDHQSVQSVLVIQSKSKGYEERIRRLRDHQHRGAQRGESAVSCEALGHKA